MEYLCAGADSISEAEVDQVTVDFEPLPVGIRAVYVEFADRRMIYLNENESVSELLDVMGNLPRGVKCAVL
jgi:hypothetical protein